jgi:hypothetical protein
MSTAIATEFRRLPVKLSDEEQRQRGKTMAERVEEYNREEADAKAASTVAKARLKNLRRDIDQLADVVTTCTERRDVECAMMRDDRRSEIVWMRLDTHEEIERRPMTETERQQPLFHSPDA